MLAPESGEFYSNPVLSPVERAQELVARYPEMAWMVDERTHATPESSIAASGATVGAALFPSAEKAALSEFDRAYVGIAAMDWVRSGDYESLTACQPEATKLSRETFEWLRTHTAEVLSDEPAVQAMETFLAINDLGKIGPFADKVRQMPGAPDTVDHDVIMHYGLEQQPALSPSFARLDSKYRQMILQGMGTSFNLGQLIRGEGLPASLVGLTTIDEETRNFYLLHTLYDLGGAVGQFVQNGSMLLTEPMVRNYRYAYESIKDLAAGKSLEATYHDYLRNMARHIDVWGPPGQGVPVSVRLAGMLSLNNPEQKDRLLDAYGKLHRNTFAILEKEMFEEGNENKLLRRSLYGDNVPDRIGTLIYYAPSLLLNLQKQAGEDPAQWQENITLGMETLARVYQAGRTREVIRKSEHGGVQTILISDLARAAAQDPELLRASQIVLEGDGLDVEAKLVPVAEIDLESFPRLADLADLPGKRFGLVGMGGGSDGVQAAIFSQLLTKAGKTCPAVVSVRTAKPQSQGSDGTVASNRQVRNHGGELTDGVFSITPDTQGTGRFLEHLPAGEVPMYLVADDETTPITDKLQTVFDHVGGIDTVIGLDTGGDVLHPTTGHDIANATPDQDVRSLNSIKALGGMSKYCMVVAPGIDSPENASEILQQNGAIYFEPNTDQAVQILQAYARWRMDGSSDRYFGKTPLAWQAALKANVPRGVVTLDLPRSVVASDSNPWNPYVVVQPAMRGAFIMNLDQTHP